MQASCESREISRVHIMMLIRVNQEVFMKTKFYVTTVSILVLIFSGCLDDKNFDDEGRAISSSQSRLINSEREYTHPFQYARIDNDVVLYDKKDNEFGERFIVGESVTSNEEGEYNVFSGVMTMKKTRISPEKYAEYAALKGDKYHFDKKVPLKTNPSVLNKLYAANENDYISVSSYARHHVDHVPISNKMELAIANSDVRSYSDKERLYQSFIEIQKKQVEETLDKIEKDLAPFGIEIVAKCKVLYCFRARINKVNIARLETHPSVRYIDDMNKIESNTNGLENSNGSQLTQFYDENYMGDNNPSGSSTLRVAVIEHGGFNHNHFGFREVGGSTADRIVVMRSCSSGTCSTVSSYSGSAVTQHSTSVSYVAVGDITDNQDPGILTNQEQRSGHAREALLYHFRAVNDSDIEHAVDDAVSYGVDVINMSISYSDTPCTGDSTAAMAIDDAFEAGVGVFFAGGSNVDSSPCQVKNPGGAMGAFVVGALTTTSGAEGNVRRGTIDSDSPRGGTSTEGYSRTIIDILAANNHNLVGSATNNTGYLNSGSGSSISAPLVTAAAISLKDFYRNAFSNALDNPGKLYAHMLLMGDRQAGSSILTIKYSSLWGAGRMKMRKYNGAGMDSPYQMMSWSTCIDDGEDYILDFNGGNIVSSDVDSVKAVAYWHDPDFSSTSVVSDIDLKLEKKSSGGSWTTIRHSNSYYDEKERVFSKNYYGSSYWRLRITGWDVPVDDPVCGTNSIRVHIAAFYEDNDRDDGDGPSLLSSPSSGSDIDIEL